MTNQRTSDIETFLAEVEGRAIPEMIGQGSGASDAAEDLRRLVVIVRELRDRLARAALAELALLDLRRALGSDFEPSHELGAELLVRQAVERLSRVAKLETLLVRAREHWGYVACYDGCECEGCATIRDLDAALQDIATVP